MKMQKARKHEQVVAASKAHQKQEEGKMRATFSPLWMSRDTDTQFTLSGKRRPCNWLNVNFSFCSEIGIFFLSGRAVHSKINLVFLCSEQVTSHADSSEKDNKRTHRDPPTRTTFKDRGEKQSSTEVPKYALLHVGNKEQRKDK